jgi:hypothetical protein
VIHIDTGIGVPEGKEFVIELCKAWINTNWRLCPCVVVALQGCPRATLMLGRYLSHGSKFGERMFRNKVVEYAEKEA